MDDEQRKKLLNRFFYIPMKNNSNDYNFVSLNKKNYLEKFEDIDILDNKLNNDKRKLSKLKIKSLREIIVNQNKIPQKWIQKSNYKKILKRAINQNYIKYAYNYYAHNNIKEKKENEFIIQKLTEVKTPIFSTIAKEEKLNKIIEKDNSKNLMNKIEHFPHKIGKSLNKILSYQKLNTEFSNLNKKENKNIKNGLKNFPTEFNLIKKELHKKQNSEIYNINIKDNFLQKNFKSIGNFSSRKRNKLILPFINAF